MRYDELRALLSEHFKGQLQKKKAEIDAEGRLSLSQRQHIEHLRTSTLKAKADGSALALSNVEDDELLRRFIAKFELNISPGTKQYEWLRTEIANSYVSYLGAVVSYDDSLDTYDFTTPHALPPSPKISASKQTGLSIATLAADYRAEKQIGDNWVARTKLEKIDHIKLLEEILGAETDVRTLSAIDGKKVKSTLLAYPKNRFKKPETKGKTLAEVIAMKSVEHIQVPTINKYLQTYNDLFEWGKRNGHVDTNVFSGLSIRQKRKGAQDGRSPFAAPQVKLLLDTLIRNEDRLVKKDYQKWGPLIGLYTGARLNEIAQIELKDIRQDNEIWLFDLNDEADDKQLKSVAARRLVPIHHELITLGLLQYVEKLRARRERFLFHELTNSVEHGRGRNLGRWFNEKFLPKLNIKSKDLVFHSLRHTVVTKLMQADIPEPVVKALVGHAQSGVTQQSYFKQGYTITQLNDALQKLEYTPASSDRKLS